MLVKFVKPNMAYNVGEIASFDGDFAEKLIEQGVAEAYVEPKPVKPKKEDKEQF